MTRWHRSLWALVVTTMCVVGLWNNATPSSAQNSQACFAETGFCLGGRFRQFWQQNGGLAVFGYPLSNEANEGGRIVQYFERQRFELHTENPAPYDVLLGRLGVEVLARNGIDWQTQPTSPGAVAGCQWFPETKHNVCDQDSGNGFLTAWSNSGLEFDGTAGTSYAESLALFGLPITEAYQDTINGETLQVMWFERARFEWHPNNPAAYRVLFGRLGAEVQGAPLAAPLPTEGSPVPTPSPEPTPAPSTAQLTGINWQLASFGPINQQQTAVATSAATLQFATDGRVSGSTGCNTFTGSYTLTATQVAIGTLAQTKRACNDALEQQERAIVTALQGTVRYEIRNNTLHMFYNQDQSVLTYGILPAPAPAQLSGTSWRLASFGSVNQQQTAVITTPATLQFGNDAHVSGSSGCNSFGGPYTTNGSQIIFGQIVSTLVACVDPTVAQQERDIFAALQGTVRYEASADTLRIFYNQDQSVLTYTIAPAPTASVTGADAA